jgi:myo-inositol 2-dehydrogenase / D-chiro-inositol 1-dehydrogenase
MKGIGIIGTGNIGTDHARRLARQISGASVTAVFDVDTPRARAVAAEVHGRPMGSAQEVIDDDRVDAVLIAAPGEAHAELVLACLAAGKPVLCEKPLAPTAAESEKVLDAEVTLGRHLVQVGFMRRFDPGYRLVKDALADIGPALVVHCVHRNPSVPTSFTSDMSLTDSVVHEIDVTRWLLGEEVTACTVVGVRRSPLAETHLRDPQVVLLETESGTLVEVEVFVNAQYGYDVRCEVVGTTGVACLETPSLAAVTRAGARSVAVPKDWRARFGGAYLAELQSWVASLDRQEAAGPSAWDGYAAAAVAEACVRSLETGTRAEVTLVDKPAFYS